MAPTNLLAQAATATVALGSSPSAIAVNPVTNKVYVSSYNAFNVTVIDGVTHATTVIEAGDVPPTLSYNNVITTQIAVNSVTNKIYVANGQNGFITVIDGATNATTAIPVGSSVPGAVAVNSVTNKIYVANMNQGAPYQSDGSVTVIDGTDNTTTTVAAGKAPYALAVNSVTNKIYVANEYSNDVTVIDGATNETTTVAAGANPAAVAVNPTTNKIYVANYHDGVCGSVTAIDGATNETTVIGNCAFAPQSLAVNPSTNKVYALDELRGLTVIDGATNAISDTIYGFSLFAQSVAVNPITNKVYVDDCVVIDGATNAIAGIWGGRCNSSALAINQETDKIYAAELYPNSDVIVIDGGVHGGTYTVTLSPAPGTYTTAQKVVLSDITAGAAIYYTTNDTAPTTSSTKYVAPISVATDTYIRAIAVASGYGASAEKDGTYNIVAATPTFSPAPGTYHASPESVKLEDSTPGATIYYSTDGTTPTTSSKEYVAPISVSGTTTIKAIAWAAGYDGTSAVATGLYTITATPTAVPVISPASGTYSSTQWAKLTVSTSGATIYYTVDGSTPTTASTEYTGPITVSATRTINAMAVAPSHSWSAAATAAYSITPPAWAPTFSLATGTYSKAQSIMIGDTTPGATIHYTTDGSNPSRSSPIYTAAITVSKTTTIKAIAVASGYANSPVSAVGYTIAP